MFKFPIVKPFYLLNSASRGIFTGDGVSKALVM